MPALDFHLLIGAPGGEGLPVRVLSSPAGEATAVAVIRVDGDAFTARLHDVQAAVLGGGGHDDGARAQRATAQAFGADLFDALFVDEVRSLLDRSRDQAAREGQRLRIQLRVEDPAIAALPWELLYDRRRDEHLCLSTRTPIIRYVELADAQQALPVTPPLRLLAMVASPSDLPALDVVEERTRITNALAPLVATGRVELRWLEGQTWRDLQVALLDGPWHVFHFVGHGAFDEQLGEGVLALCDEAGASHRLSATELGILLGDHDSLRLAVLNACDGARTDQLHPFSGTATALVRRGTPAVVAMQYAITDSAALELSRTFYGALVSGKPVDSAVGEARKAVAVGLPGSLEWVTPVLYLRAPDGVIFDVDRSPAASPPPAAAPAPAVAGDGGRDDIARTTGYLLADIKAYRCALGYGGVSAPGEKREGDGTVPGGRFALRQVLYRPDRMSPPSTRLPVRALGPDLVWCDDPGCADYNRLVSLPHPGSYEELWREDNIYDLLAVVGYNDDPVVPGAGSAIFLHIARPGLTPTVGCIGIALPDLVELLGHIDTDDLVNVVSHPDARAAPAPG